MDDPSCASIGGEGDTYCLHAPLIPICFFSASSINRRVFFLPGTIYSWYDSATSSRWYRGLGVGECLLVPYTPVFFVLFCVMFPRVSIKGSTFSRWLTNIIWIYIYSCMQAVRCPDDFLKWFECGRASCFCVKKNDRASSPLFHKLPWSVCPDLFRPTPAACRAGPVLSVCFGSSTETFLMCVLLLCYCWATAFPHMLLICYEHNQNLDRSKSTNRLQII